MNSDTDLATCAYASVIFLPPRPPHLTSIAQNTPFQLLAKTLLFCFNN